VEPTLQMNAPYLEDMRPTFVVHGLSPLQSKVSYDKMSEIITSHIKTMKISTVLMVSSLLLKVGSWNSIHNHSGEETQSNANLSCLSQAIDIITHESALPYLGKDATSHSVSKRAHGNTVPPSRHIDRVSHGTHCRR
jgi:hypothetical protein